MAKNIIKVLSVLILLALCIAGIFFYSIFVSVKHVNIHYQTITSHKIPESLDHVSIAFISDIYFDGFMTQERLSVMIDSLNEVHPDVVIFGGDMFTITEGSIPSEQATNQITELLSKLEAPLGKFAVFGDQDHISDEIKDRVANILYNSNFEIINNQAVRLRNRTSGSITLIGVDALIHGAPDYQAAFSEVNAEEFNLMITHCPDLVDAAEVPLSSIDYVIAGHSLGGQIYLPLLGPFDRIDGAVHYNHGLYQINTTKLFVSNGLGTSKIDMRLFAPPQIPIFHLQHGQAPSI